MAEESQSEPRSRQGHGTALRVYRPRFDPLDAARVEAARGVLPWPIARAPFWFDGVESVLGVYLAASYWSTYAAPYLRVEHHICELPGSVDLSVAPTREDMLHAFGAWHSYRLPSGVDASGSTAWLARLLTILSWLLYPRVSPEPDPDPNMMSVSAVRASASCAIVPGGNLHGLVVCGLRVASDMARAILDAVEDVDVAPMFTGAHSGAAMPRLVADALYGVVPIPGLDFGLFLSQPNRGWDPDRETSDVSYVWGRRSLARGLKTATGVYRSLVGLDGSGPSVSPYTLNKTWTDRAQYNFDLYRRVSRDLVMATAWMLRAALHHAFRLHRHFDVSSPYLARPSRWSVQLHAIAEIDAQRASDAIYDLAARTRVPLAWLWESERRFEALVREQGQIGLVFAWGLPVLRDDSLERCLVCVADADPVVPALDWHSASGRVAENVRGSDRA